MTHAVCGFLPTVAKRRMTNMNAYTCTHICTCLHNSQPSYAVISLTISNACRTLVINVDVIDKSITTLAAIVASTATVPVTIHASDSHNSLQASLMG